MKKIVRTQVLKSFLLCSSFPLWCSNTVFRIVWTNLKYVMFRIYLKSHFFCKLKKIVYSQLSLRRTPLGPVLSVRLREMSVLQKVKQREQRKAGTSSRCPFYRGVRLIEVSVKRESTVLFLNLFKHSSCLGCGLLKTVWNQGTCQKNIFFRIFQAGISFKNVSLELRSLL